MRWVDAFCFWALASKIDVGIGLHGLMLAKGRLSAVTMHNALNVDLVRLSPCSAVTDKCTMHRA